MIGAAGDPRANDPATECPDASQAKVESAAQDISEIPDDDLASTRDIPMLDPESLDSNSLDFDSLDIPILTDRYYSETEPKPGKSD